MEKLDYECAKIANLYMTFKTEYELEQYVYLNLAKNERSVLAQFRCGILPIRVETGRYVGELLEERFCRILLPTECGN